ncbi:hypothetical protein KKP04_14835 [Rhodomicrobium sp. Az07]|uniref:MAE_28990/MAE_18760 family HEPN-like nuclease n=1 Tax=Rhodomicrobium sp. Az07 TaxID=2839034 RepID=UPI001BE7CD28|nr:MAE_28990/MAE_18760 family HEPN-like nuclease [Rhodomicrobium sp. Az07]MBT3072129.1 hypothetical protein [Rhodomicrobium sp. Az07]
MLRPRSLSQLQDALDQELGWRKIELHALLQTIRGSSGRSKQSLLRAAVPILYAHWEGFVKSGICLYIGYLSSLGLKYRNTKQCFRGVAALEHVRGLGGLTSKIFVGSELLKRLYDIENETFNVQLERHIGKIGNLNFDLFEQILSFSAIDVARYVPRKQLIDESLLKRRNEIAHGRFIELDEEGVLNLSGEVLTLIEWVKTDIENAASTQSYSVRP